MPLRVIAEFMDRKTGRYVLPGQPCPQLDPETTKRLVAAGCLQEEAAPPEQTTPESPSGEPETPVEPEAEPDVEEPAVPKSAKRKPRAKKE